ncbi:MAG TPA: (2Fe-2S)-binding protein [Anaerolineaceae bacterium]|nr:(2Fe-2S)-binding protein [Anaerolineaceae bacterium]
MKDHICLNINNQPIEVDIQPNWTLLYVLREVLDLTGTKCGCKTGDCGACKVIIDGKATNSCGVQAAKLAGKKIETIEGLASGTSLHPIQQAFVESGAIQCGYCTPGMIMTTKALLDSNPKPEEAEIRQALGNNLCRCTGYVKIVEAVKLASRRMQIEGDSETK